VLIINQLQKNNSIRNEGFDLAVNNLPIFFLTVLLMTLGWMEVKKKLNVLSSLDTIKTQNLSFRKNYHLFIPYFFSSPTIPIPGWVNQVPCIFNNDMGVLDLLFVTNPSCTSCKKALETIIRIQEKHNLFKSVSFLFHVNIADTVNEEAMIASNLINSYDKMNSNKWLRVYQNQSENAHYAKKKDKGQLGKELLSDIKDWCVKMEIVYTPTFIIEGKLFPYFYQPSDLEYFAEELKNNFNSKKTSQISNYFIN
jgi:thiol-disulfide isomerase/thioredoxin